MNITIVSVDLFKEKAIITYISSVLINKFIVLDKFIV